MTRTIAPTAPYVALADHSPEGVLVVYGVGVDNEAALADAIDSGLTRREAKGLDLDDMTAAAYEHTQEHGWDDSELVYLPQYDCWATRREADPVDGAAVGHADGYQAALDAEREAPEAYSDPADVPADAAITAVRELLDCRDAWSDGLVNALTSDEICRRYGLTSDEGPEWEQFLHAYDRGCQEGVRQRLDELEAP